MRLGRSFYTKAEPGLAGKPPNVVPSLSPPVPPSLDVFLPSSPPAMAVKMPEFIDCGEVDESVVELDLELLDPFVADNRGL